MNSTLRKRIATTTTIAWAGLNLLIACCVVENSTLRLMWLLTGVVCLVSAVGLANAAVNALMPKAKLQGDVLKTLVPGDRFASRLQARIDSAMANRLEFAVAIYDVQGMDAINNKYGAPAGNLVLETMATILRSGFEEDSIISRIEGDKFIVAVSAPNYRWIRDSFAIVRRMRDQAVNRNRSLPKFMFTMVHLTATSGTRAQELLQMLRQKLIDEKGKSLHRINPRTTADQSDIPPI